ncbi:SulP family inorganic anion transporter [Halomarina rubra]|uniref:SulP family inorganic anion transporter n=1 Tax=Halomarina rubra TaxID=2071873 RepID=A0ABD6ATR3_9EURY|nr:sulfate permease [Halomarina rubra]
MATGRLGKWVEEPRAVLPVVEWLPRYRRSWLRLDVVAGLTVTASVIPESMAYATLAGMPPQTGLYAALLAVLAYALFGTSRQVVVGPTSALAILLAGSVGAVATGGASGYAALVATTTVLVGVVALVAWLLRLGFLVNFISGSVLTGFSAGAALYIMSTQLGPLLGIEGATGEFYERLWFVATHLDALSAATAAVGLAGVALFVVGERFFPRAPNALVVVGLAIVAMQVTDLQARGVAVVGEIPSGLPSLTVPALSVTAVGTLLPAAVALFLLSYVQGISAVETFAREHDYRADSNQELLATGVANLAAGVGGGFAVGGSMSRSALNDAVGGRTQLVNFVVAGLLVLVLLFLTSVFTTLPEAILAAVVIVAVKGLVDVPALRRLYAVSRAEFAVAAVVLVGVLVVGLLWGVFLGVAASLLVTVARISDPQTETLGRVPGTTHYVDRHRHPETTEESGVLVYRVDAELFYANAEPVRKELVGRVRARDPPPSLVVVDLSTSPTVDVGAAEMLGDLHEDLADADVALGLAGVSPAARRLLVRAGVDDRVGPIGDDETIADVVETWRRSNDGGDGSDGGGSDGGGR